MKAHSILDYWEVDRADAFIRDRSVHAVWCDCLLWTAMFGLDGYGRIHPSHRGPMVKAHRAAYEVRHGRIQDGLVIDHRCRTTACVNPDHMEVVTPVENTMRGVSYAALNATKTHCMRGHPFDAANTIRSRDGCRRCRACERARLRRYAAARMARHG